MEISILYQDRQVTLTKPETRYGSNIEAFTELAALAFQGVGLNFEGEISEIKSEFA